MGREGIRDIFKEDKEHSQPAVFIPRKIQAAKIQPEARDLGVLITVFCDLVVFRRDLSLNLLQLLLVFFMQYMDTAIESDLLLQVHLQQYVDNETLTWPESTKTLPGRGMPAKNIHGI